MSGWDTDGSRADFLTTTSDHMTSSMGVGEGYLVKGVLLLVGLEDEGAHELVCLGWVGNRIATHWLGR